MPSLNGRACSRPPNEINHFGKGRARCVPARALFRSHPPPFLSLFFFVLFFSFVFVFFLPDLVVVLFFLSLSLSILFFFFFLPAAWPELWQIKELWPEGRRSNIVRARKYYFLLRTRDVLEKIRHLNGRGVARPCEKFCSVDPYHAFPFQSFLVRRKRHADDYTGESVPGVMGKICLPTRTSHSRCRPLWFISLKLVGISFGLWLSFLYFVPLQSGSIALHRIFGRFSKGYIREARVSSNMI